MKQYCSFYYKRLEKLRSQVKEAAELKWELKPTYVDNILDLQPGELTVIIGTLFKEMKKKPCVFDNIEGVIRVAGLDDVFSEDDYAILEDASGRIQIRETDKFSCRNFVTGSIAAFLGKADS